MEKRRIVELDYIRVFSMLAVIAIHATSAFILVESRFVVAGLNLAFYLNQAARFAVPAFVLLSGVGLSLSNTRKPYGAFVLSRIHKIGPAYLLWCFLYSWYYHNYDIAAMFSGGNIVANTVHKLLTGSFASHLYFIVVILQLYLIYPGLKKLQAHYPRQLLIGSIGISLIAQGCIYMMGFEVYLLRGAINSYLWLLFPSWLVFFVMGMYLNEVRLNALSKFAIQNKGMLLLVTLIYIFFFTLESKYTNSYTQSLKPQMLIFMPLMLLFFLSFIHHFMGYRIVNKVVGLLSNCSMTVYFSHVMVLSQLRKKNMFTVGMSGMVMTLLTVAAVSICFGLGVWLLRAMGRRIILSHKKV